MLAITLETKVCNKCGKEQPIDQYCVSYSNKDGRTGSCKKCRAKYARERYQYLRHVEAVRNGKR